MALNKDTHVNASVILPIDVYELVRQQAKRNGRSASTEMARAIEKVLGANNHDVDCERERQA